MSATISIEIPREVIHATRMTPQELKRYLWRFSCSNRASYPMAKPGRWLA